MFAISSGKAFSQRIILAVICIMFWTILSAQQNLDQYNITWDKASSNAMSSMPVGGCDVGCNVWAENGSIYVYFGRSNSFDENNALLKSGRIKITFSPNPFKKFSQQLKLKKGFVELTGRDGSLQVATRLWVEPDQPVIHADIRSSRDIMVQAEYQYWRYSKCPVVSRWVVPSYIDYPGNDVYWFPDTVKQSGNAVIFYHRNNNDHLVIDKEIEQQDLLSLKDSLWNPLRDYVFGGIIGGDNFHVSKTGEGSYLNTPFKFVSLDAIHPAKAFSLHIALSDAHKRNDDDFEKDLIVKEKAVSIHAEEKIIAHQQWWQAFWERSWIMLDKQGSNKKDSVWQAGRNYNIFRYQLACNSKGEYPTKFNGGLFTVDPVLTDTAFARDNPDFRAWGGGVMTAQNQRLLYWPLLKTGDFDFMTQQFDFYRRACANAEMRTRYYWKHDGCCFTDQMSQAGIVCGREYGWDRPPGIENGLQSSPYHEYYFTTQLENAFMMLEYYRYSDITIQPYIHFIKSAIRFFDEHYRMLSKRYSGSEFSAEGKYNLYPCMALETYSGNVRNPADVITALMVLTTVLQQLPPEYISKEERDFYKKMQSRIPAMPERIIHGVRTIAPAEHWDRIINVEIPQLYPVFPWGVYTVGNPDIDLAINTWKYGVDNDNQKDYISWHQDAIFCARMGLTEEAKSITLKKLADSKRRFPTFWGPGHDWLPDHNWGGSGMIGLQEMLMQTTGKKIYLFPAWPRDWNVYFKLHAPFKTTVEGIYRNGRIEQLKVMPQSRMGDIILPSAYKSSIN